MTILHLCRLLRYSPATVNRAGGVYARTINETALTLRVKAMHQVSSNTCELALTGSIIKATNRLAVFNFAMCPSLSRLGQGRKLEKRLGLVCVTKLSWIRTNVLTLVYYRNCNYRRFVLK